MPVQKYHHIADVGRPAPHRTATENLRAAFDLIAICHRLRPFAVTRGVQRYRSIADLPAVDGEPVLRRS
jgi:hypothetical protein